MWGKVTERVRFNRGLLCRRLGVGERVSGLGIVSSVSSYPRPVYPSPALNPASGIHVVSSSSAALSCKSLCDPRFRLKLFQPVSISCTRASLREPYAPPRPSIQERENTCSVHPGCR